MRTAPNTCCTTPRLGFLALRGVILINANHKQISSALTHHLSYSTHDTGFLPQHIRDIPHGNLSRMSLQMHYQCTARVRGLCCMNNTSFVLCMLTQGNYVFRIPKKEANQSFSCRV